MVNEFETRKQAVVKSLFAIGESGLAKDFSEATELCSFESVEYSLRERLKASVNRRWSKVIANAIVEAQCLPHISQKNARIEVLERDNDGFTAIIR